MDAHCRGGKLHGFSPGKLLNKHTKQNNNTQGEIRIHSCENMLCKISSFQQRNYKVGKATRKWDHIW